MQQDLVIIGGGAGGLVVASVAARLGCRVTLVERRPQLGGDCLHYGCVPSKTLIRSAQVARLMRRSTEFGLPAVDFQVELGPVMERVRRVVADLQRHDDPERFRGYGCTVKFGTARFLDPHHIEVNGEQIAGRRFVIATGSSPEIPPIPGLDRAVCHTNESIFSLETLPARLTVVGAGPVGMELAQSFARLGSRVTVVEQHDEILPQSDTEAAARLREVLEEEGVTFHLDTTVKAVEPAAPKIQLGTGGILEHDALLIATGRRPNLESLHLEAAGITPTGGHLEVDRRQRTSQRHIFAVGDVCGPWPFTHMAEYQAGIVLRNAVFRLPARADYRVVPRVTYCDPELAEVGLSEAHARQQELKYQTLKFPFRDNDRALAEAEPHGFVKLLVRRNRLLGAVVLGAGAGELIHELALAMQTRTRIGTLAAMIHAYPTLSQAHRRAANRAYEPRLFHPLARGLVRAIQRLLP